MDPSKPQNILITGAGGFLGSLLAAALLKSKYEIDQLLLCDIVEPKFQHDQRLKKVKVDLADPAAVDNLLRVEKPFTVIAALHGLMYLCRSFLAPLTRSQGLEAPKRTGKAAFEQIWIPLDSFSSASGCLMPPNHPSFSTHHLEQSLAARCPNKSRMTPCLNLKEATVCKSTSASCW
jgi:nucleoside-diphosphate-sugar epimerase